MSNHGLTSEQLQHIRHVLAPFAVKLERVGLFGSRATGKYRANSDIDMVLYGTLDDAMGNHISTLLNDSIILPVKVDVHVYHLITYPPLKEHIDAVMLPLFTASELIEKVSA